MQSQSTKNNTDKSVHITRENLFVGLSLPDRIDKCIKLVEGLASQFLNETSIMLDLARNGASVYASCEAENDTDICAFLAQLDIEAEELSRVTISKLRELGASNS